MDTLQSLIAAQPARMDGLPDGPESTWLTEPVEEKEWADEAIDATDRAIFAELVAG